MNIKTPVDDRKYFLPYYLTVFQLGCQKADGLGENFFNAFSWDQLQPSSLLTLQQQYTQGFLDYSKGLQTYFEAPIPESTFDPQKVKRIWHQSGVAIYDLAPDQTGIPVVLVAPYLLGAGILMANCECPLSTYLASHGFKPLLLVWEGSETLEPSLSFETWCAKTFFSAYGFLLGLCEKPPLMLFFWESVLCFFPLFLKQLPFSGAVMVGQPPLMEVSQNGLLNNWKETFLKQIVHQNHQISSTFVRLLFSFGKEQQVVQKMTKLGQQKDLNGQDQKGRHHFVMAEDSFNHSKNLPHFLAYPLLFQQYPDSFHLTPDQQSALGKKVKWILPKQQSKPLFSSYFPASAMAQSNCGNYGLVLSSCAQKNSFNFILKALNQLM